MAIPQFNHLPLENIQPLLWLCKSVTWQISFPKQPNTAFSFHAFLSPAEVPVVLVKAVLLEETWNICNKSWRSCSTKLPEEVAVNPKHFMREETKVQRGSATCPGT